MQIGDFLQIMDSRLPLYWAEEWDNCGLMAGNRQWEVSRVALALDATEEAVLKAEIKGCQLLVVHHPLIYSPLSKVDLDNSVPRTAFAAISRNMSIVSYHTNWDKSPEGVNFSLGERIGLCEMDVLVPSSDGSWGLGAIGDVSQKDISLYDLAMMAKKQWDLEWAKVYGNMESPVERVALCGGSGGDLWPEALSMGADTFITADMKYHQIMAAREMGMRVICVDHGEMEWVSISGLGTVIADQTGLETVVMDRRKDLEPVHGVIL